MFDKSISSTYEIIALNAYSIRRRLLKAYREYRLDFYISSITNL